MARSKAYDSMQADCQPDHSNPLPARNFATHFLFFCSPPGDLGKPSVE